MAAPDSSNCVRGLDDLLNALVGEAVFSVRLPLSSARKDRLILPFYCNDATWVGHLECEGSVVRYCIKASEIFASE